MAPVVSVIWAASDSNRPGLRSVTRCLARLATSEARCSNRLSSSGTRAGECGEGRTGRSLLKLQAFEEDRIEALEASAKRILLGYYAVHFKDL
jgi:hypothetical protein